MDMVLVNLDNYACRDPLIGSLDLVHRPYRVSRIHGILYPISREILIVSQVLNVNIGNGTLRCE